MKTRLIKNLFIVMLLMLPLSLFAAGGTITGKITEAGTNEVLPGANVTIEGTRMGAASGINGVYTISSIPPGEYNLVVNFIGYKSQEEQVTVEQDRTVTTNFVLESEVLTGKEVSILADRAQERKTPVAFSTVKKAGMEARLGSRDIPLIMNVTPSVYATPEGGGAGDARINVRGFNQRNVAIMINGVPVNDMENGWLYWSNWDGLGDATSSIQMQRGLSAVNLATPSIGGTMNIITDPTAQERGATFKQEFGSGGFLKSTLSASTGLLNEKFAFNATIVRKTGEGIVDKTWADAWAYYFGGAWQINKTNRLEVYATGAPQRHGQNLYAQNIATYSHEFAKSLDDYDQEALEDFKEQDSGQLFNQNWAPVRSSYSGQQAVGSNTFDRYSSSFIAERENFYHKPLVNLNWYSQLSEKWNLFNTLYYSGGQGGGTGTLGDVYRRDANGVAGDDDHRFYFGPSPWTWDWDKTIDMNSGPEGTYWVDQDSLYKRDGESLGILRNSRNNQGTIGLISKANFKASDALDVNFGIDWRTATIEHYREVRDLLGGRFFHSTDNEFWGEEGKDIGLGSKVDYNFTNTVDWIGGFGQAEYTQGRISAYGMAGYSVIKYTYTNHFVKDSDGGELTNESDNIGGYQIKGGAKYSITEQIDAFTNLGYVSKVPIFDNVMNDRTGIVYDDYENETFTSFEVGVNYFAQQFTGKLNFYYTDWQNRGVTDTYESLDGTEYFLTMRGLDALHMGVELEAAYQPVNWLRFDGAASIANWENTNDVSGLSKDYDNPDNDQIEYTIYANGLKVGDAPQTQFALGLSFYPVNGLFLQGVYRYYANHYAEWNPITRNDPNDRVQSWKAPNYGVLDLHAAYQLPVNLGPIGLTVTAHVFNALDEMYIQDALDNSEYNSFSDTHSASDAEVFFGLPRFFNVGLRLNY